MLPPQPTGSHSPAYYYHRDRINRRYHVLGQQTISAGHEFYPQSATDPWAAESVRIGLSDSLARLEYHRRLELDELLAAEFDGRLSLSPSPSSFVNGAHQSVPMPVYSPIPLHHTGMMWGPSGRSFVPGTLSEPFMEGHGPVMGQYHFAQYGTTAAGAGPDEVSAHPGNDAQTSYLYNALNISNSTRSASRHSNRGSTSRATLDGTTLVGHEGPESSTAATASVQAPLSKRSSRYSSKRSESKSSPSATSSIKSSGTGTAHRVDVSDLSRTASSNTSSLTATWIDEAKNYQSDTDNQHADEATVGDLATKQAQYTDAYPLSTSSSTATSSGHPLSVLTSNISPGDSISQHGTSTTSRASTIPIPTMPPASRIKSQTNAARQAFSNCSRPSQTRGSTLSPIAEASSSSSRAQTQSAPSSQGKTRARSTSGAKEHSEETNSNCGCGKPVHIKSSPSSTRSRSQLPANVSPSRSSRSSGTPSSGPSAKSNPTSSSSGHLTTPYMAYAGTTMETEELKATSPERWRAVARANAFDGLLLVAVTAAFGNPDLLGRLKRHEGRFHFYNALEAEADFDGRNFTPEERRIGRGRHFDSVRIVALTRRGGSDELPKEIAEKVQRFHNLNEPSDDSR